MAGIVEIDSAEDPRLADYVRLRDVQLRRHVEAEHGIFLAEGEKVIRRAVASGHRVRSFLMTPRWLAGLEAELRSAGDVPCYLVSDAIAEAVTGFHVHRGALASLERKPLPALDEVLARSRRVVVLEDVVDHANVGAIFRCAAALAMDAIVVSPRCADPLYRRSIKVAMGAVFTIPWTRLPDWYDALPVLKAAGFTTVALTVSDDAASWRDVAARLSDARICLILGTEGSGLSRRWMEEADVRARIDIVAGVDSLNVAAAAAIACYSLGSRSLIDEHPR